MNKMSTSSDDVVTMRHTIAVPEIKLYTNDDITRQLNDETYTDVFADGGLDNPGFDGVTADVPKSGDLANTFGVQFSESGTDAMGLPNSGSEARGANTNSLNVMFPADNGSFSSSTNTMTSRSETIDSKGNTLRGWDVFRELGTKETGKTCEEFFNRFRKCLKIAVAIFLTIVVMVTTVISKSTLLLMTSNIYVNLTLNCTYAEEDKFFCVRVAPNTKLDPVYRPSQRVQANWIWALCTCICMPYLLTFIKSLWKSCFKKTRRPKVATFIWVMFVESCHTAGICLLVFLLMPTLDSIRAVFLLYGVLFVPSLFKLFDRLRPSGRFIFEIALDIVSFVVQLSALFLWLAQDVAGGRQTNAWAIPLTLILISIGWWENYVSKWTAFQSSALVGFLQQMKKSTRRSRTKIYIFLSLWKIILTLMIMTFVVTECQFECVKALYFRGNNMATGCGRFIHPDLKQVQVQLDAYLQDPFWIALLQILSTVICYYCARTACKVMLQVVAFAIPLILSTSVVVGFLIASCEIRRADNHAFGVLMPEYLHWTCDINGNGDDFLYSLYSSYWIPVSVLWWCSFIWVSIHIWFPQATRMAKTERLFLQPFYCGVLLDQSLVLNRRRDDTDATDKDRTTLRVFEEPENEFTLDTRASMRTDSTPMIYACATMWHETQIEMEMMLKSLFRMDLDQSTRRYAQRFFDVHDPDYYEFEGHIFFDDAFNFHTKSDDGVLTTSVNGFVQQLVSAVDQAASIIHHGSMRVMPPVKYNTPFGGRLEWAMPGGNILVAHLKDKTKIRHKKRWSQVMYMYYFLGQKLMSQRGLDMRRKQTHADNTFLLTLDGDVDFQPSAVQLLVDKMKKNEQLGAACGRIHPAGSGLMVWYQKFEYAISHWLLKSTEHMIGCVLCSPGCFSLFRASALMDDNVMRKYASPSSEARHYVQYDQGEDRWLSTLLLQQGYRVEYCAAADALTYAPEGFYEFCNQRRRWVPSTMANIMDLLLNWRKVVRTNENISLLYIVFQSFLFISAMLTPGTIFMLIVGTIHTAFPEISLVASLAANLVPVGVFILTCIFAKPHAQLRLAGILALIYSLVQMLVMVGLILEIVKDGICSTTTIFLMSVIGAFLIAGLLHPQEFMCLIHGFIFFLAIPTMSMLLLIYSVCNMHVISWGTRETKSDGVTESSGEHTGKHDTKKNRVNKLMSYLFSSPTGATIEDSDYSVSFGNLFKCLCCPKPAVQPESNKLDLIMEKLLYMESNLTLRKERNAYTVPISSHADVNGYAQNEERGRGDITHQEPAGVHDAVASREWIHDSTLGYGEIKEIEQKENDFWTDMIEHYLYPLATDSDHQEKINSDLRKLRNKTCLTVFMLNALLVIVIFTLQYVNATSGSTVLAIIVECKMEKERTITLEPLSVIFMAIFGIVILVQFVAMVFHRFGTMFHVVASTDIGCWRGSSNMTSGDTEIYDKLHLVQQMQMFSGEDDTQSVSSVTTFESGDEDDTGTRDARKNNTVLKLAKRRRKQQVPTSTLSQVFLKNYVKLAKEFLENEAEEQSTERQGGLVRKPSHFRKDKKSARAVESFEQNRDVVVERAHIVRNRWHDLLKRISWAGVIDPEPGPESKISGIQATDGLVAERIQNELWTNLTLEIKRQSIGSSEKVCIANPAVANHVMENSTSGNKKTLSSVQVEVHISRENPMYESINSISESEQAIYAGYLPGTLEGSANIDTITETDWDLLDGNSEDDEEETLRNAFRRTEQVESIGVMEEMTDFSSSRPNN